MLLDIESTATNNPNEFWSKINRPGPPKSRKIPVEVVGEDGQVYRDEQHVYNSWKQEFSNLYICTDFDNDHYTTAKSHKQLLENTMSDPLYICNDSVIMSAKSNSVPGINNIPYAVLKFPPVIVALHSLFQLIFDISVVPSIWRKSVIFPILKDPSSDRRVPLKYRGISLLPCISKLYTSFLNRRLTKYLEQSNLLADEQNGFRSDRLCEDHIFTLNGIIRNNDHVYASFIDLKKAFDFIDRELLLYKFIKIGVDGKLYNSLKCIYATVVQNPVFA